MKKPLDENKATWAIDIADRTMRLDRGGLVMLSAIIYNLADTSQLEAIEQFIEAIESALDTYYRADSLNEVHAMMKAIREVERPLYTEEVVA